jgi:hypothetical protein
LREDERGLHDVADRGEADILARGLTPERAEGVGRRGLPRPTPAPGWPLWAVAQRIDDEKENRDGRNAGTTSGEHGMCYAKTRAYELTWRFAPATPLCGIR